MRQPKGCEDPSFPNHVCRLHRSLYGLKQAPRAWFQHFSNYLEELGFIKSEVDYSLFTYHQQRVVIILLVYVDDILITSNSNGHVRCLLRNLEIFSQ